MYKKRSMEDQMQHTDYIAGISSHIYFILQAIVGNDFEKKKF